MSAPEGQTPNEALGPQPPADFDQWPFYYASLQCQWVFWYTDIEKAEPYVKGTGLKVAQFPTPQGNKAVVLLNFQRYTAHYNDSLGTTNEVEFNIVAYPENRSPGVPFMSINSWLRGDDQTKTLGHLRIHVAADNAIAVQAGRAVFGEPKFVGFFKYNVPTLNARPNTCWDIKLLNPDDKAKDPADYVYHMNANFRDVNFWPTQCTPIPEFACGLGRTVWTRWTIMGQFQTAMLNGTPLYDPNPGQKDDIDIGAPPDATGCGEPVHGPDLSDRVSLSIGENDFKMTRDLKVLIGEDNPAVAAQTFSSIPGCVEPAGFWVDGIQRGGLYD